MKSLLLGNPGQWRATEGNLSFGLITQRSKVQILPPQPNPLNNLQESNTFPTGPLRHLLRHSARDSVSGVSFAGRRSQRTPALVAGYAGMECTLMRKERSDGTQCFWCAPRSGTSGHLAVSLADVPADAGLKSASWKLGPSCRDRTR